MDWKRGLLRLWTVGAIVWLLVIDHFASKDFLRSAPFGGNYQYEEQLKEMPWNPDWSKPFYERTFAPAKGKFSDQFDRVDDTYIEEWDKNVKNGKLIRIEFPDLTISVPFSGADNGRPTVSCGAVLEAALVKILDKNSFLGGLGPWPTTSCSSFRSSD